MLDVQQGSPEWIQARLGIPTASRFSEIITPSGAPSTSAPKLLNHLLAEWLVGAPVEEFISPWMQRGTELEPEARRYYEFAKDCEVQQAGFVLLDDRSAGCSPDGLTPGSGCEFKCPAPGTHVEYLLENRIPPKYVPQVQGCMYICERESWDWISYHPSLPPVIITVERDEKFIKALEAQLRRFNAQLQGCKEQLIERGYTPKLEIAA